MTPLPCSAPPGGAPRAIDFRAIQGSLNADGLGNLLSGLAGTVPNSTYSLSSSVAQITGIASRVVGMSVAGFFFLFALLPKLIAAVLAIPSPVVGAYLRRCWWPSCL